MQKPLQYFYWENPINSMKRQKDTPEGEPPGLERVQHTTGEDLCNWPPSWSNSRFLIFSESLVPSLFLSKGLFLFTLGFVFFLNKALRVGTLGHTFVGSLMRTLLGVLAVPPPLNLSPGLRDPPHSVQTCSIELLLSAVNRSPLARRHLRDLWT